MKKKARHPMQPVVVTDTGTHRFKENTIVRFLLDNGSYDMNSLATRRFSTEDYEQFAQLIGYSVSGFCELNYASEEVKDKAWKQSQRLIKKETKKCSKKD